MTTLFFYANAKLYALYGVYINGFVFNLLFKPGGLTPLGGSAVTDVSFTIIGLGFFLLQISLLYLAIKFSQTHIASKFEPLAPFSKPFYKWRFALITLFMVITLHMTFAFDRLLQMALHQWHKLCLFTKQFLHADYLEQ